MQPLNLLNCALLLYSVRVEYAGKKALGGMFTNTHVLLCCCISTADAWLLPPSNQLADNMLFGLP